jgi:predicted nucleic acid-binding protein
MRFWDSSALVPLCVDEGATKPLLSLARDGNDMLVWWASLVECDSAIARLERDRALPMADADAAFRRLDTLKRAWVEIEPRDELREIARRMLRVHQLRAADAMQLAAAYVAAERRPATLQIVTLDDRLQAAAIKEGFVITPVI